MHEKVPLATKLFYHYSNATINAYENKKFEGLTQARFDLYKRLPQAAFKTIKGTFLDQLFMDENITKMIKSITNDYYPLISDIQDVLQLLMSVSSHD